MARKWKQTKLGQNSRKKSMLESRLPHLATVYVQHGRYMKTNNVL